MLIITYYWPPTGGVGVQRWLKFSKYLPASGWTPVIYTPSNPDTTIEDKSLLSEVPENLTVLKQPIWEPFKAYSRLLGGKGASLRPGIVSESKNNSFLQKLTVWIRGNLFLPDSRRYWISPSVKFLREYLDENKIDLIVSTGPPHSCHLIALKLTRKLNIKWIADFRDPWSEWDVLPRLKTSSWAMAKHRILETSVVEGCDHLLTVSPRLAALFGKGSEEKSVITNGFDFGPMENVDKPKKFRLCHAGLFNETKYVECFWQALEELIEESDEFKEKLEIVMAGDISQGILEEISNRSLGDNFNYKNRLPYNEISELYDSSSVLLLFLNQTASAPFLLPNKVFEYLAKERHILVVGMKNSDVNDLLMEVGADPVIDFNDKPQIKEALMKYYQDFKNGSYPSYREKSQSYSRKEITLQLSAVFDKVVDQ